MTPLAWLLAGFIAGMITAAPPVGPITSIILGRCVQHEWARALANTGPAVLSNGLYSGLVLFGYQTVVEEYPLVAAVLRIVIVVLVAGIGVRFAFNPPKVAREDVNPAAGELVGELFRGLAISLVNPSRLGTWAVALDIASRWLDVGALDTGDKIAVAGAVAVGTAVWFLGLIAIWSRSDGQLDRGVARGVLRVLGVGLLIGGGAYLVSSWPQISEALSMAGAVIPGDSGG